MQQKREKFQQFLIAVYQPALDHAQQRARYHQRVARWLEWILIGLSAITTFLLAISSFLKELPITPLIAICSAIVTAIATTMKSLETQEKWSFYQKLESDLQDEYYLYAFDGDEYKQLTDKEGRFVKRITDLLRKARQDRPRMTHIPAVNQPVMLKDEKNG